MFAMTAVSGCAGSPATAPKAVQEASPSPGINGGTMNMGEFQFVFGDDGSVKVEPVQRAGQFDVTAFAWVVIDDFHFNSTESNWYVTATIKNISNYTGYDVLAVFHTLGNKYVTNQDGYIWVLPPLFPSQPVLLFWPTEKTSPTDRFPLCMKTPGPSFSISLAEPRSFPRSVSGSTQL